MTAQLPRGKPQVSANDGAVEQPVAVGYYALRAPRGADRNRRRLLADHPDWPLVVLLAGYPVIWALGLSGFIFIILAIPMATRLYAWHVRGRRLRFPPGFFIWLLFLVVMLAGVATLRLDAPGTLHTPVSNRLISFADRSANYLAVTVLLLFACNLAERECSRRKLAWLLGLLGIYSFVGGFAGMIAPHVQFTSPLAYVLPQSITNNTLVQSWMHPALAQIQSVLGEPRGRPMAPFAYTNQWGNSIVLLVPWLLVWAKTKRQRRWALGITVTSIVPIVYSLNRGTWLAVAFCAVYLAVRLAARGRLALLGAICAGTVLLGAVVMTTPLQDVITQRLTSQYHNSNDGRSTLDNLAIQSGLSSPLIGYGDLQHMRGSPQSIAVGPQAGCITCGQLEVGSTGQLWQLLITDGILGAGLYLGFFGYGAWRFRRDTTPCGMAGVLVLLLTFVFMIAYNAVVAPLAFTMLAYALLWRNQEALSADPHRVDRSGTVSGFSPRGVVEPSVAMGQVAAGRPPGQWQWSRNRVPDTAAWMTTEVITRAPPGGRKAGRTTARPRASAPPAGTPRPGTPATRQAWLVDAVGQEHAAGQAPRTNQGLAEVARGSTLNLVGAIVSAGTTVAVTVLVTRQFAPAVAGAFFSATSLFLILESVTGLGAYAGAVYFIARLRLFGEERRINQILRAAIIPVAVASATAASVLLLFAAPVADTLLGGHLGRAGANTATVAAMLRALAVTLPFAALLDTILGGTRGYRDMRPTMVIYQLGRSLGQLAGVGVAVAAGSIALLAPLWALPYVPAAAAAWLWLRHIRADQRIRLHTRAISPDPAAPASPAQLPDASARGFWRFTAPRAAATLAQIIIQRLDIVLVGILKGPSEAAIYTAATRFLVAGQLGNAAISMAAQPQFTELFATHALRRANALYQTTTAWLILLTWPVYLLVMVYGPEFLKIFGHPYQTGYVVIVILGVSQIVTMACGQVDMVLITTGRSSWSLVNGMTAMAVNVAVDLLLIPRYGITGAAIGWGAAVSVSNALPLVQVALIVRLHPFSRGSLIAGALCLASFGLIPFTVSSFLGTGLTGVGAGVSAGLVVAAIGLWYFRRPLQLSVMPGMSLLRRRWFVKYGAGT
jgi:O-antigen/teichoic acid export membrane protein